jgi:hypothetical protein
LIDEFSEAEQSNIRYFIPTYAFQIWCITKTHHSPWL